MTAHGASEETFEIFHTFSSYDASVSRTFTHRSAHPSALLSTMARHARAPLALFLLILGAASSRAFQLFPTESHLDVDAAWTRRLENAS